MFPTQCLQDFVCEDFFLPSFCEEESGADVESSVQRERAARRVGLQFRVGIKGCRSGLSVVYWFVTRLV